MPDTLLDDVDELLLKEKGDRRVLEQIKRAAENNEVISIYERNYVAKLRSEFLEKTLPPKPSHAGYAHAQKPAPKIVYATPEPKPKRRKRWRQKKFMIGAGCVILAALLAAGVSLYGSDSGIFDSRSPAPVIALSADAASYSLGDIVLISGQSDVSLGSQAVLSIQNPGNDLVWSEVVNLKPGGTFSTLTIAAGDGWDDSGVYTLTLKHGRMAESVSFSFAS